MLLRTPAKTVRLALCTALGFPEIVTVVSEVTELVDTVNVAEVALAGTATLVGTWAAEVLLLERATVAPPAGAGPFSVTVPVEEAPPGTEVGFKVIELSTAAVTVRAPLLVPPYVPEMVSRLSAATGLVVTAKVAVVALGATVTLAGTCAAAVLLLESVTTAPPVGAGPLRVTVPVEELPPTTDEGVRLTEASVTADPLMKLRFITWALLMVTV